MIFGPDGKPLCEPLGDGDEGILKANVNLRDIDYPKAFIDPVGHCKETPKSRNCPLSFIRRVFEHNSKFDIAKKGLRWDPADFVRCRCATGSVEPVGESDKRHACYNHGEIGKPRYILPLVTVLDVRGSLIDMSSLGKSSWSVR